MGATYTRQSSYTDGDTITAAHTNDEFNQLLAAFAASTGHTHDGTTAEGGPVTTLLGNTLSFGDGTTDADIVITFNANNNDGVLSWKEDEDYFEFSDDVLLASTEKLQFRDTAIYINSSTDGQLDLIADTEIQLAATTIDINGNVDISGTLTIGSAGISEAELEILDGATVTTAELNIMDGDTSASATTVVDADRVVFNDAGTMKQVAVTDLAAYFDDEITAMPNLVTTAATTVGALNSGSITSGFGTIDTGSSTITTTGLISGGSLDIDDVLINGATIGHTDDTDLITLSNGIVTIAGELEAVSLDISGDADIDGTLEADAITVNGTALSTVIAGTTVTNATNATNAVHVSVADNESTDEENLITFIEDASATGNVGLESDGNFSYNPSTGTVTATIFKGNIDAVDGDFDGTLEADAITVGGTALATVIAGTTVTDATNSAHVLVTDNESTNEENLITFVEGATSTTGNVGLEMDGNLSYNPSTGTVSATIFKGNIDAVDGDFDGTLEADAITVGGTALATVIAGTTVTNATNSAHVLVTDNESTNEENLIAFVEGATSSTGNVGLEMDGNLSYNPSTGTVSATIFKGNIDAVDGDFDGTLEADAINVDGTVTADGLTVDTTTLHVDATNNRVGVGTTSPSFLIHAVGSDSTNKIVAQNATGVQTGIGHGTNDGRIGNITNHGLIFLINNAEKARITTAGQFRLAGAGITFNGDSADANELDDYEEGSFTPTLTTNSGNAATADATAGSYTKIGRLVNINVKITNIDTTGTTASSTFQITNLPFVHSGSDNNHLACRINGFTPQGSRTQVVGLVTTSDLISFSGFGAGTTSTNVDHADLADDTADVFVSGTYHTST